MELNENIENDEKEFFLNQRVSSLIDALCARKNYKALQFAGTNLEEYKNNPLEDGDMPCGIKKENNGLYKICNNNQEEVLKKYIVILPLHFRNEPFKDNENCIFTSKESVIVVEKKKENKISKKQNLEKVDKNKDDEKENKKFLKKKHLLKEQNVFLNEELERDALGKNFIEIYQNNHMWNDYKDVKIQQQLVDDYKLVSKVQNKYSIQIENFMRDLSQDIDDGILKTKNLIKDCLKK